MFRVPFELRKLERAYISQYMNPCGYVRETSLRLKVSHTITSCSKPAISVRNRSAPVGLYFGNMLISTLISYHIFSTGFSWWKIKPTLLRVRSDALVRALRPACTRFMWPPAAFNRGFLFSSSAHRGMVCSHKRNIKNVVPTLDNFCIHQELHVVLLL